MTLKMFALHRKIGHIHTHRQKKNQYQRRMKLIFNRQTQKVNSGGSGCGCIASVFSGFFAKKIMSGELKKVLLIGTGALMSPSSVLVGEPISGIAHAVAIERV